MCGMLLIVAPAVLVAALSVRRGEAAGHVLPEGLLSELPLRSSATLRAVGDPLPIEWLGMDATWSRKGAESIRLWMGAGEDVLEVRGASRPDGDNLLLYFRPAESPAITDLFHLSVDSPPVPAVELALPPDAVLLGAWPNGTVRRLPAEGAADGVGVLLLYDLAMSRVVGVAWLPGEEWSR